MQKGCHVSVVTQTLLGLRKMLPPMVRLDLAMIFKKRRSDDNMQSFFRLQYTIQCSILQYPTQYTIIFPTLRVGSVAQWCGASFLRRP